MSTDDGNSHNPPVSADLIDVDDMINNNNNNAANSRSSSTGPSDAERPPKRLKQTKLVFTSHEEELKRELGTKSQQLNVMQKQLIDLQAEVVGLRTSLESNTSNMEKQYIRVRDTMIHFARQERTLTRQRLFEAQHDIGYVIVNPTISNESAELWVWGQRHKDLLLQHKATKARKAETSSIGISSPHALRREDLALRDKLEELEHEKLVLLKEIRRVYDEDRSKYAEIDVLCDRYVLFSMLGRGGFSEVWKAFDVHTGLFVALKIHTVSPEWPEERRRNYIRHSRRECEVHLQLDHHSVIQLYDVCALNDNTFMSVMEFSQGQDLDTYLKRNGTIRETDAKVILLQLLHGLRYLSEHKEKVIHYDLKPANILFVSDVPGCLDIKITDFGLCKIIGADGASGGDEIELTSQGTGTYWYLPPECFDTTTLPRISAKVDVWAVGIVFFQMLYGRRPFGEGMSQKQIWHSGVITKAKEVEFPQRPQVSAEARDFIRKCLNPSASDRPDIAALFQDVYVQATPRKKSSSSSSSGSGNNTNSNNNAAPPTVSSTPMIPSEQQAENQ
eukprot:PhM_4_TR4133/c0_g1_i1/m.69875/K08864/TLK; tousled-like kinase